MNVAFMCSMLLCLFISPPSNAVPEIYKKTKTNSAYGKAVWNGKKRPNACGHGNVFFDTPLQRSVCRHVGSVQVTHQKAYGNLRFSPIVVLLQKLRNKRRKQMGNGKR